MSYQIDKKTGEIVINGWENGIADSEIEGIADIRNMNLITVPKEASVNFAVSQNSLGSFSGNVVSASTITNKITYSGETGTLVSGIAIVFANLSGGMGISNGSQSAATDSNVYYINSIDTPAKTFTVRTTPTPGSDVVITGTGTGTFTSIDLGQPRFSATTTDSVQYVVDHNGRVWYQNGSNWIFTNNITRANAHGNGLVYYQASNGTGYLFVFRNALIDYMPTASIGTWTYGWKTMNTANGTANSHHAIVGQDNVVYYCDSNFVGSFFEKSDGPPQTIVFDPTNAATYTFSVQALKLPYIEIAQYLTELGINLMIAGQRYLIYPWDRTSTSFKFPIFMADTFGYANLSVANPNIPKMITINTNAFIFMGVRGRIYITNGTQAQLYKKVPDFLSGTVEPYFRWGGVGFNKNQLYFGVLATTNGGAANNNFGGLWAIDMDSKALRLVNQFSYGTYAGYCTLIIPLTGTGTSGSGFYAGWDNNNSGYGIDASSSAPYTNYESYIDTDLIPIGTYLTPSTNTNIEWKLAKPLVSGEGVKISYRLDFSQNFTTVWENTTAGVFSDYKAVNFQRAQWLQLRIETKSTSSTPSYVRLTEIRLRKQ